MAPLKLIINLFLVVLWSSCTLSYTPPRIEMTRLSNVPLISSWNNNSDFLYNYNSAFMPTVNDSGAAALLVRVQNLRNGSKSIYNAGPSKIALSRSTDSSYLKYTYISEQDVIIDTDREFQALGVEDPRLVLFNNTYYVMYTALNDDSKGTRRAQLALATCEGDCFTKTNWIYYGPLFPNRFWSKSGSLLIHNDTHRYLFFGDSSIYIAQTKDLIHYDLSSAVLLKTRPDHFDSALVESGPQPLKLSDKNYLFLYNSGQHTNIPNPKPGWNVQYNLGWAILNGDDPTQILARAEQPILSPELDWERCDNTSGIWASRGLTPIVVFIEGWKQTAENTFLVWYQGCDSSMGLAELKVYF
jgi:predicted GH43/DUF377 family glycosyl hydrolase